MSFALTYYGIKTIDDSSPVSSRSPVPFVTAFEDIITLSTTAAKALMSGGNDAKADNISRNVLLLTLSLLDMLVSRLDHEAEVPFVASWDPAAWLSTVLECIQQKVRCLLLSSCVLAHLWIRQLRSLPSIA